MTRRALFATLLAPLVAKYLPKPKPAKISMRFWRPGEVPVGYRISVSGYYIVERPRTML